MGLLHVRFTLQRLMTSVAVLAIVCRFGESIVRHPSPRTCLPPVMILYLMWAFCDGFRIICLGLSWSTPRVRLAIAGFVLVVAAGAGADSRWADFREKARLHGRQAFLCRLSAGAEH